MWKLSPRLFFICSLFIYAFAAFMPLPAAAAVQDWQRSFSIMSRGQHDFGTESFRQSITELKKLNPTHVTLIITLQQKNIYDTNVIAGKNTPTDEALESAIRYIHSLGMKTHLKFHIETEDRQWRAYINPAEADRAQWFASYTNQMLKYAAIAERHHVDLITLGTEMTSMTADDAHPKNTERWRALINQVRAVYSGKITYCANSAIETTDWNNEKIRVKFWDDLDYISFSTYHGMSTSNPTVASFKSKWDILNKNDFSLLQKKYNKPVLFGETGYRSVDFAHLRLYDYWSDGPANQQRQADLYEALFSYWNDQPYLAGVHLWHWSSDPTEGGPENTDYTPRGKKAESIIAKWWGGTVPSPLIASEEPQLKIRGRMSPSNITTGQQGKLYIPIDNFGATLTDTLIDIEVYNAAGERVFQRIHEHKTLPGDGGNKTYEAKWTPLNSGIYTIRVGVFTMDWNKLYQWEHKAGTFTVTGSSIAPTQPSVEQAAPAASELYIWWPTQNATLAGLQPFKAALDGSWALSEYMVQWRVDGGPWQTMGDAAQDGPHKESVVQVTDWPDKGSAPYTVEFLAKNTSGQTIVQKSVTVYVVR